MLRTVTQGYRLQFSTKPPMSDRVLFTHASGPAAFVLGDEILSLPHKGAIQEVISKQNRLAILLEIYPGETRVAVACVRSSFSPPEGTRVL